jgi:hypothetical protein
MDLELEHLFLFLIKYNILHFGDKIVEMLARRVASSFSTQLVLGRKCFASSGMTQTEFSAEEIIQLDKQYLMPFYQKYDLIFTHGEGVWLYTHDNKKYLDCFSGIAVSALGHAHPTVVKAIQEQAENIV